MKNSLVLLSLSLAATIVEITPTVHAQDEPKTPVKVISVIPMRFPEREARYWKIETVPVPKGIVAEVTGILSMGGDQVMVSTRHGEVWVIEGASTADPKWSLFVDGLQEPLGLAQKFIDKNQSVSDATYARALEKFGEPGIVEMAAIQGYYTYLAMIMNAARVTVQPNATPSLERFPRVGRALP